MFGLDSPSTIPYTQPSWTGGVSYVGGLISGASGAIFSTAKAALDPVSKNVTRVQNQASLLYNQGKAGVFDFIGDTLSAKNDAVDSFKEKLTATGSAVLNPFASGIKWVVIIVGLGVAIYVLAVIGPFLPKPGGSRA